jgi:hypothetical protein
MIQALLNLPSLVNLLGYELARKYFFVDDRGKSILDCFIKKINKTATCFGKHS